MNKKEDKKQKKVINKILDVLDKGLLNSIDISNDFTVEKEKSKYKIYNLKKNNEQMLKSSNRKDVESFPHNLLSEKRG